jgi:hypothetical protein
LVLKHLSLPKETGFIINHRRLAAPHWGKQARVKMTGLESVEWYQIHQAHGFHGFQVLDAIPLSRFHPLL